MTTFGKIYGDTETPAYITDSGAAVWMWRKGQRVRFPSMPAFYAGLIAEVRAKIATANLKRSTQRTYRVGRVLGPRSAGAPG